MVRKKGWTHRELEKAGVITIDPEEGFPIYDFGRLARLGFDTCDHDALHRHLERVRMKGERTFESGAAV